MKDISMVPGSEIAGGDGRGDVGAQQKWPGGAIFFSLRQQTVWDMTSDATTEIFGICI